jgi:dihydroorotate dehydrogenase
LITRKNTQPAQIISNTKKKKKYKKYKKPNIQKNKNKKNKNKNDRYYCCFQNKTQV